MIYATIYYNLSDTHSYNSRPNNKMKSSGDCGMQDHKQVFRLSSAFLMLAVLSGCNLATPDSFKLEAQIDRWGSYDGMKAGFGWDLERGNE